MWDPTHVKVTVQRAKDLIIKGKNGTNNCFVTIALGKEKYQTTVIKHKANELVKWQEECELKIPSQGNVAEIVLKVYDEDMLKNHLLGQVSIPLKDLDLHDTSRTQWYPLLGKPGKESKHRGELEVKITFIVKEGSTNDLNKKDKFRTSLSSLTHNIGGSLMSIGSERRAGILGKAKNFGSIMGINKKDKHKKKDSTSLSGSIGNLHSSRFSTPDHSTPKKVFGEVDSGQSEDEDDFTLEELSHGSSASSLNTQTLPRGHKYTASPVNASLENLGGGEFLRRTTFGNIERNEKAAPAKPVRHTLFPLKSPVAASVIPVDKDDEWSQKLYPKSKSNSQSTIEREKSLSLERNKALESPNSLKEKQSPKNFKSFKQSTNNKPIQANKPWIGERIIDGEENTSEEENSAYNNIPPSALKQYEGKTREDLIVMIYNLQKDADTEKKKLKDLENYLDDLLLRVMETTPRILQNPYARNNSMHIRNK